MSLRQRFEFDLYAFPRFFYWLGKINGGRSLTSVDVYTISKFKSCWPWLSEYNFY